MGRKLRSSRTNLIENISAGVAIRRLILQNALWRVGHLTPHPDKKEEFLISKHLPALPTTNWYEQVKHRSRTYLINPISSMLSSSWSQQSSIFAKYARFKLVIISTSFFDPQNFFLIFSLPLPLTKPIFSKNSDWIRSRIDVRVGLFPTPDQCQVE